MARLHLRYLGHRPGASLMYFTGAQLTLSPGDLFAIPDEGLVIGRVASATLRVASSEVARHHLRVRAEGDRLVLQDQGSTLGSELNGERFSETVAKVGDRVTIAGLFDFEVVDEGASSV